MQVDEDYIPQANKSHNQQYLEHLLRCREREAQLACKTLLGSNAVEGPNKNHNESRVFGKMQLKKKSVGDKVSYVFPDKIELEKKELPEPESSGEVLLEKDPSKCVITPNGDDLAAGDSISVNFKSFNDSKEKAVACLEAQDDKKAEHSSVEQDMAKPKKVTKEEELKEAEDLARRSSWCFEPLTDPVDV